MSDDQSKERHSRRRQNTDTHIAKQKRIAKSHGLESTIDKKVREPHRMAKHHAMNCGDPKCYLCSNPRKTNDELTIQEKRLFQDVENIQHKKGNGTLVDEIDIYLQLREYGNVK